MRKGFTLSETLISLGIIGVVAAITIPGLMNKYQKIILKNQFKKTLTTANLAIRQAKAEADIDTLSEYCTSYNGQNYINNTECKNLINRVLPITKTKNSLNYKIKTYDGTNIVTANNVGGIMSECVLSPMILTDGSSICFTINEHKLNFTIDINGYAKPNRLGHDVFYFYVDSKDNLVAPKPINYSDEEIANSEHNDLNKNRMGYPCKIESIQKGNGIGCGYYALQDKCPYKTGKSYFDCLPK